MDVHIAAMDATVRAVDDRSLLSPGVLDSVANAVIDRLGKHSLAEAVRRDEATPWSSVRSRGEV